MRQYAAPRRNRHIYSNTAAYESGPRAKLQVNIQTPLIVSTPQLNRFFSLIF
jgi:hypothetical protein